MFPRTIKNVSGFTLTEVMVTVIIVSVLAAVALPRLTGTFERVRAAEGVQILTSLLGAQKVYEAEKNGYTAVLGDLDVSIDRAQYFDLPPTVADPADPVANPIAAITRTGSYTLDINEEGDIACTNGGAGYTCAQAGF